jgi:hypothetical protein
MRLKRWPESDPRTAELISFWDQLPVQNPALHAMCVALDEFAQWKFEKEVTVTSIWRITNDPNRLHRNWQAVDFRIHNDMRDGPSSIELTLGEWNDLHDHLNHVFRYGRLNSKPWKSSKVLHLRVKWAQSDGGGRFLSCNTHAHLQERGRRYWK